MAHVESLAAAEGREYHLADGISGNTLLAHELGGAVEERLLHAHFAEQRSVSDVDRTYGAAGAQPAEVLLQLLERAWAD